MSFNPLALIVTLTGAFLLVKLRFFFVLHPLRTARLTAHALKAPSAMHSLYLALAGTLGVGNIFGVCVGLLVGGAGSVFWMLVSVLFASVLKYAEVLLSKDSRAEGRSADVGMLGVIKNRTGKWGAPLSLLYSWGVLLLSFFMGGAMQVGSVCGTVRAVFGKTPPYLYVLLLLLILCAVSGGGEIIKKLTARMIPVVSVLYVFLTVSVIIIHSDRLAQTVSLILSEAFSLKSAGGGFVAFFLSGGFKEGFSRGLMSNEAGAGTSCIAHSENGVLNPAHCGLLGIVEVFFDTAFLCLLTAFAVLTSTPDFSSYGGGMELIISSIGGTLGAWAEYALLVAVFGFAFSSIICWFYYGCETSSSVFCNSGRTAYFPLFMLFCAFGAFASETLVVSVTDALLLAVTAINCFALVKNSDRVKHLSELGGVVRRPKKSYMKNIKGIESLKVSRR